MEDRLVDVGGQRVRVFEPEAARAGVVLVGEAGGVDDALLDYARQLAAREFTVAIPDLWWRRGGAPPARTAAEATAAAAELSDPEALRDIAAARGLVLGAGRTFVVGFSVGGVYARLAACAMLGFAGAVEFYGRIVYPTISARKPMQPLDLLPGLGCPLQCHFGDLDPVAPPAHVEALEARLRQRPVPTQLFHYPDCGHGFMNPARPGWDPAAATLAWARATTFLDMLAEA